MILDIAIDDPREPNKIYSDIIMLSLLGTLELHQ